MSKEKKPYDAFVQAMKIADHELDGFGDAVRKMREEQKRFSTKPALEISLQDYQDAQDEHYAAQLKADLEEGALAKDLRDKTEREDQLVNRILAPLTRMVGMLQRIEMHLERLAKR